MSLLWLQLFGLFLLMVINGFFAGCEIAYVSLREGQLNHMREQSENGRARRVAALADAPSLVFSACQIGITLAGVLTSLAAARSLTEPLQNQLHALGTFAEPAALVTVTLLLTYFTLIIGELVPKRIAMQHSETWALFSVDILRFISTIARPAVWILEASSDLVLRAVGQDPKRTREGLSEEELRNLLTGRDDVTPEQRSIIDGAFEIEDRTLREILVPRGSVVGLVQTLRSEEAIALLSDAGYSRAPVHTGDLDDVLGIVHVRDLVNYSGIIANRARRALVLPESLNVLDALRRIRGSRQQMALVVDEHGGVEGIVTVEDLLEEIVGEIYDEFDKEVQGVEREADGTMSLPGNFPIHDLEDIGMSLPDGDGGYATVAGFILSELGHIPVVGEIVETSAWHMIVSEMTEHAITKVRVQPAQSTQAQSA